MNTQKFLIHCNIYSIQTFIKLYSSLDTNNGDEMDVQLVLDEIGDLTFIECSLQTIQSLAFIVGYGVHKYMKRTQPCHVCIDLLTIDKDFIFDEDSQPEFRLLQLTDRGLKYPSEFILESIVTLWKTLIAIESKDNLMAILMQGSSRKILVEDFDILRRD